MRVLTFDEYSWECGVPNTPPSFPETHKKPGGISKRSGKEIEKRILREMDEWARKRDDLKKKFDEACEKGEIREPTSFERLEKISMGEGECAEAAKRALKKRKERRLLCQK